ncbi:MAG: hypothetical protein JST54_19805 [Deltaproteobacteria bacterium]|nr:hypothetical protein [Deltaproteobacteria bacterium]
MKAVAVLMFITTATLRNLLRRQLQRLRQPRYLAASAMGFFYLWSIFARHGMRPTHGLALSVESTVLGAGMLALFLLIVLWTWTFGGDEASLTFSEAEIQFLFPAPLTRRALVHYKLARTLFFSAFTALFLTWGLGHRIGAPNVRFFIGAWMGVATLGLHNISASLTRGSLLEHGVAGGARRLLALLVPAAIVGAMGYTIYRVPFPSTAPEVQTWFLDAFGAGPLRWVSAPIRPALEVALALPGSTLPLSLAFALLSLGAHYTWALTTDANFQEASIAAAERRGKRLEARRRGQLPLRAAKAPWRLSASGSPIVALLWKNLTAGVRLLSLRMGIAFAILFALAMVPVLMATGDERRVIAAGCLVILAGYFTLFGTQVYRLDFRLDLPNIDMLRTLPLRGWQVAAGEVLAPATVVAAAQWCCLLGATLIIPASTLAFAGRAGTALGLALLLPPVNLCLVIVQNAGVLLFPGWVQSGVQGPRGIEAMGQRMLTLIGTLLAAALGLIPAGVVGAGVFALVALGAGWGPLAVVLGAAAGALVLLVEAAFGVLFLGRCFERFDLSQQ